jgi:hypothetical protein
VQGADAPETSPSGPRTKPSKGDRDRAFVQAALERHPDWRAALDAVLEERLPGEPDSYAATVVRGWEKNGGPPRPRDAHSTPAARTATERRIAQGEAENAAFIADLRQQINGTGTKGAPLCLPPTKP